MIDFCIESFNMLKNMIIVLSLFVAFGVIVLFVFLFAFSRLLKKHEQTEEDVQIFPLAHTTSKHCDFCCRQAITIYSVDGGAYVFGCLVHDTKARQAALKPIPQETIRN